MAPYEMTPGEKLQAAMQDSGEQLGHMTGAEHYRRAEHLAFHAHRHNTEHPGDMRIAEITAGVAQIHATLALAAAQAMTTVQPQMGDSQRITDWGHVIGWGTGPASHPQCEIWRVQQSFAERCHLEPDHNGGHDFVGVPF